MSASDPLSLLHQIAHSSAVGQRYFPPGLLPAYRYNSAWLYRRADPNLFFTAITAFTLQRLLPWLVPAERIVAQAIIEAAIGTYPLFQNKDGELTANFYATRPSRHFPNGWLMHRFRHFKLPDDIDDTAMVFLTRRGGPARPTPTELASLQQKLARHANRSGLTIRNTYPDYRDLRAYSTWFGQHMPIEFDACALANMLYCIYEYGLPLDVHAQDSLTLLADMVRTDRYRTDPFRCAPNYAQPALIAYHIARLLGAHAPQPLQPIRDKLIRDLSGLAAQATTRLERVVLGTSLLQLGQRPPAVDLTGIEREFGYYSFFIAGMLSAYGHPFLRWLAPHPFWHIRWQCDDHCRTLLVEYLVLSRRLTD